MSETLQRTERSIDVDQLRELVARMDQGASAISGRDPDLSRRLGQLAGSVDRAGVPETERFQRSVAYAFQEMEKLAGPISSTPPALRAEMERLATTMPGLQHERLQSLLADTRSVSDPGLVRDIRQAASDVARSDNQATQQVQERVAALESRVRLAPGPQMPTNTADGLRPSPPTDAAAARSPANDGVSGPARPAFQPEAGAPVTQRAPAARTEPEAGRDRIIDARGPGLISLAFGALSRARAQDAQQNEDRAPTSVGPRSQQHENDFQQRREQAAAGAAERSQAAALDSVQAFARGPGSSILAKIQEAAKSEPGGMSAVLSEMKESGRYAGLRSQFNADMVMEKGMAAAYDKMAGNLQQYGADRAALTSIADQRGTTGALSSRFESMDAEIGKATSMLPSKADGKSVTEELGDKLREIVERAVNAVRTAVTNVFEKNARADNSPSPSPS